MLKTLVVFLGLVGFLVFGSLVLADDNDLYNQYLEKQKQIQELNQKIDSSKGQQKTLASTIAYLNDKIALKTLEIEQTEQDLKKLEEEIATLTIKIGRLDESLTDVSRLLVSRVGASYKRVYIKPLYLFLSSSGFSNFFESNKYLKTAQQNDRKILLELQTSRDTHQEQKNLKQKKQEEVAKLQEQLLAQQTDLATQKIGKQELLEVTKNDEKRFQALLAAVQSDLTSITNALASGGVKIGPVKTGDVIGTVGSSGCSTGPHLHFEVFENAKVVNGSLTQGNRVNPQNYLENGSYTRPVPGYPERVTTWYGEVYFLGVHTGIDIANSFGTPIHPIKDGVAYFVSSPCNYNIAGGSSIGKGILVDHENGIVTLYWHIP